MARDPWEELAEELVHGSEEEFVAALTERMMALFERGCANPDEFAAIASRAREAALGVWAEFRGRVSEDTERAFMEALSREQELVEASLAEAFGGIDPALTARGRNEVAQAARGMATIVERQNVALADNLADEWWEATSDAVTRIQLGDALEDVVRDGARRLADAGIETIDYKSGARTSVDAAVRRHAITQQNQCRNDMLVRECHEYGVDLVFTSAHYGARPEHAAWQGKPCGLDGPCEVDGVRYPGLVELTGYGTVTGLCGANCRHRLTPYIPGLSELPDTEFAEFEAKYHMSSDEYYEAAQRQRALERQIRATKREIALGEAHGADMTEDRYRLGAQQKRLREHCRRTGLPRDYAREQAYAVADKDGAGVAIFHQPTALSAERETRSWTAFKQDEQVRAAVKASDMTQGEAFALMRDGMEGSGMTLASFQHMSEKEQMSALNAIIERREKSQFYQAVISTHERRIASALGMDLESVSLSGLSPLTTRRFAMAARKATEAIPGLDGMVSAFLTTKEDRPSGSDMTAFAWFSPSSGTITFSLPGCADRSRFLNGLRLGTSIGEYPRGCAKDEYVFYHELAHAIDDYLESFGVLGSGPDRSVSSLLQPQILSSVGLGQDEIASHFSGNAESCPEEWFADSIAESLCSDNPRQGASLTLAWTSRTMGAI